MYMHERMRVYLREISLSSHGMCPGIASPAGRTDDSPAGRTRSPQACGGLQQESKVRGDDEEYEEEYEDEEYEEDEEYQCVR